MKAYYFDYFVIPFIVGAAVMFGAIAFKWLRWLVALSSDDRRLLRRGLFSAQSLHAVKEVFDESLLHRRLWRRNPMLGYMHSSLAFGWFLLILVGWIEAAVILGSGTPLHAHIFFRYFDPTSGGGTRILSHTMDFLLLIVLSGVGLAWLKRLRKTLFGMRRRARHSTIDRMAMWSLWLIFPLRLLAESLMSAIKHNGGFLTATVGSLFDSTLSPETLVALDEAAWWSYSIVLGLFFVALPFSRYMHIFTEIPLIFLRRYKICSAVDKSSGYDYFQVQGCSQCGVCIEECALDSGKGAMHFLHQRRSGGPILENADSCMLCGRCTVACPVGIDIETLRLQSRAVQRDRYRRGRYDYITLSEGSTGSGRTGYFIGCKGALAPATTAAMERIFAEAGEPVRWLDRGGGVCCGRPLKLTGQIEAARQMQLYNSWLFRTSGIRRLVTACPVCLRTFREDYRLEGIEVLHHTEYVAELLRRRKIVVASDRTRRIVYHDPCELGRGAGIYNPPREVVQAVGTLVEAPHNRAGALCCGESPADVGSTPAEQKIFTRRVVDELEACRIDAIATACPLCEKSLRRSADVQVADAVVLVSEHMVRTNKVDFFAHSEILTTFAPQ